MNIGLGLPISDPEALVRWARLAEAGPFRTLGLLDRLAYHNPEPLVTLAAIAGATTRIRVQTEVLIAPTRQTSLLAKQTATLDRLSGGRLTLGIGIGGREDDYLAAGVEPRGRGRRLDEQMPVLRRAWAGEPEGTLTPIGPSPARTGGPEVLFGGWAQAVLDRVARWGDGYLGAAPLADTDRLFRAVERSWQAAGRPGRPRLVAQVSVAFGPPEVGERARQVVGAYYESSGFADRMVRGILTSGQQIRETVSAFGDLGADEVMLYCWADDPDQVDRLAQLLG